MTRTARHFVAALIAVLALDRIVQIIRKRFAAHAPLRMTRGEQAVNLLRWSAVVALVGAGLCAPAWGSTPQQPPTKVDTCVKHDTSPPLASMKALRPELPQLPRTKLWDWWTAPTPPSWPKQRTLPIRPASMMRLISW